MYDVFPMKKTIDHAVNYGAAAVVAEGVIALLSGYLPALKSNPEVHAAAALIIVFLVHRVREVLLKISKD